MLKAKKTPKKEITKKLLQICIPTCIAWSVPPFCTLNFSQSELAEEGYGVWCSIPACACALANLAPPRCATAALSALLLSSRGREGAAAAAELEEA
jgi:hypothetical protein